MTCLLRFNDGLATFPPHSKWFLGESLLRVQNLSEVVMKGLDERTYDVDSISSARGTSPSHAR
jgi:hypothetical protein